VRFNVLKSDDSLYAVTVKKYSHGRTEGDAKARAEKTHYNVTYKDSVLDLGSGFAIDKDSKFRGQYVELEIEVPVGKKITFDESIDHKLDGVRFRSYRGNWRRDRWDFDYDDGRRWRTNVEYTMGSDGVLRSNGKAKPESSTPASGEYRYQDENNPASETPKEDIQKQIDEEKRKKKESEDRLRDLEKKQKEEKRSNTANPESMEDKKDIAMASPSPVFSLVKSFF
jgi:hypothetical protein